MFVTIERKGNEYKLTLNAERAGGYKSYYSALTSMKGEVVNALDSDGKPITIGYDRNGQTILQEWRITLESSDTFLIDWLGSFPRQVKYELSPDGQTMTIYDVPGKSRIIAGKIDGDGRLAVVKHVDVLDKIPQPR